MATRESQSTKLIGSPAWNRASSFLDAATEGYLGRFGENAAGAGRLLSKVHLGDLVNHVGAELPDVLALADVVVSRSGAGTGACHGGRDGVPVRIAASSSTAPSGFVSPQCAGAQRATRESEARNLALAPLTGVFRPVATAPGHRWGAYSR
ncbi:MAG: hypothetical protein ACRDSL_01870 [Pseudonocardiaceae bacterium]